MTDAIASALVNVVLLAGLPFLLYLVYHRFRKKRRFAQRAVTSL